MRVLIAFATGQGSTAGVATRLADRLRSRGISADARPVADSPDVTTYDGVVIGSAVHGGKWLADAGRFASVNAELLEQRPVWLFSVSTLGDEESMFPVRVANRLRAMRKEPREISELREHLKARGHRNFAGAIARSDWPASGRAFFKTMGGRYGDHRNWPAIDAWADRIAAELSEAVRPVPSPR